MELRDGGETRFKLACDLDEDDHCDIKEVTIAFPLGKELVDAVRKKQRTAEVRGERRHTH